MMTDAYVFYAGTDADTVERARQRLSEAHMAATGQAAEIKVATRDVGCRAAGVFGSIEGAGIKIQTDDVEALSLAIGQRLDCAARLDRHSGYWLENLPIMGPLNQPRPPVYLLTPIPA